MIEQLFRIFDNVRLFAHAAGYGGKKFEGGGVGEYRHFSAPFPPRERVGDGVGYFQRAPR